MDEKTRCYVADCLENLASQDSWNSDAWRRCYDLVSANMDGDQLLKYVHDDIIHYEGEFHSRNILGFRVKPDQSQLERYRQEFRDVACSLRARLSLHDAKEKYGL
jgi:hypothetical protein